MTMIHETDEPTYPIVEPSDLLTLEADTVAAPQGTLRRFRTFDSFRHRDFALFFSGALLSNVGSWMQTTALGWLVFNITGKSGSLGMVNFLAGIPVFFLTIFTGALADRVDRKKLLIWTQIVLMVQAASFGWISSQDGGVPMLWIYGLSLLGGVTMAFMSPAFQSMPPDLVPRESLMNAVALSAMQFNAARLVGPVVAAGVVFVFSGTASGGVTEIFWVNAASFLFVIWSLWVIKPKAHPPHDTEETVTQRLMGGVHYVREHRRVLMNLVSASVLVVFAMPHATLLPAIAKNTLGLGVSGYSTLFAMNGLGALLGALWVASQPPTVDRERIIRIGYLVLGAGCVALGLSASVALSGLTLFVMGFAFLAITSSINTNIQSTVPPQLRARVMGLYVMSFMGMMPFGAMLFGTLGDLITPRWAVVSGAVVVLAWGANLLLRPHLLCPGGPGACD